MVKATSPEILQTCSCCFKALSVVLMQMRVQLRAPRVYTVHQRVLPKTPPGGARQEAALRPPPALRALSGLKPTSPSHNPSRRAFHSASSHAVPSGTTASPSHTGTERGPLTGLFLFPKPKSAPCDFSRHTDAITTQKSRPQGDSADDHARSRTDPPHSRAVASGCKSRRARTGPHSSNRTSQFEPDLTVRTEPHSSLRRAPRTATQSLSQTAFGPLL